MYRLLGYIRGIIGKLDAQREARSAQRQRHYMGDIHRELSAQDRAVRGIVLPTLTPYEQRHRIAAYDPSDPRVVGR